jgi:hypothetical protein
VAHFFIDSAGQGGTAKVDFVYVAPGATVEVGIWGATVSGQCLTPTINDSSVAKIESKGAQGADGMLRHVKIKGVRLGNVMLEARLGANGSVWAYTQLVVTANPPKAVVVSRVAELAVVVAKEELARGVFETNNDNRGERVEEYLRLLSLPAGLPWCLSFVYWCFNQAASRLAVKNPLPRTGLCSALVSWATREQKLVTTPAPGDVLVIKPSKHAGLVVGTKLSTGKVPSIEGNTWAGAQQKEGVYSKKPRWEDCHFIRP